MKSRILLYIFTFIFLGQNISANFDYEVGLVSGYYYKHYPSDWLSNEQEKVNNYNNFFDGRLYSKLFYKEEVFGVDLSFSAVDNVHGIKREEREKFSENFYIHVANIYYFGDFFQIKLGRMVIDDQTTIIKKPTNFYYSNSTYIYNDQKTFIGEYGENMVGQIGSSFELSLEKNYLQFFLSPEFSGLESNNFQSNNFSSFYTKYVYSGFDVINTSVYAYTSSRKYSNNGDTHALGYEINGEIKEGLILLHNGVMEYKTSSIDKFDREYYPSLLSKLKYKISDWEISLEYLYNGAGYSNSQIDNINGILNNKIEDVGMGKSITYHNTLQNYNFDFYNAKNYIAFGISYVNRDYQLDAILDVIYNMEDNGVNITNKITKVLNGGLNIAVGCYYAVGDKSAFTHIMTDYGASIKLGIFL